jgi:hypothetical protein
MVHSFIAKQPVSYAAVRWCGLTGLREVILSLRIGGVPRRYKVLQAVTALKGYCNRALLICSPSKGMKSKPRSWVMRNALFNPGEVLGAIVLASISLFFTAAVFYAIVAA